MKNYESTHRVEYEQPEAIGRTSIDVLEFLNDLQWDEVALGYVHSLRPSCIRVTEEWTTLDSVPWRVTVFIDEDNAIKKISQECDVGLYGNLSSGAHLAIALKYGMYSDQAEWYVEDPDNPIVSFLHTGNGYFKKLKDGSLIEFPKG